MDEELAGTRSSEEFASMFLDFFGQLGDDEVTDDLKAMAHKARTVLGLEVDSIEETYTRPDGTVETYIPFAKLTPDQQAMVRSSSRFDLLVCVEDHLGLDELMSVDDDYIQHALAEEGFELASLSLDDSWFVRQSVAKQGVALNILAKDPDARVRVRAETYLSEHGLTLDEWIAENPDKCVAQTQEQIPPVEQTAEHEVMELKPAFDAAPKPSAPASKPHRGPKKPPRYAAITRGEDSREGIRSTFANLLDELHPANVMFNEAPQGGSAIKP